MIVVAVTWIHFPYPVRWAQGNPAASSRLKILDSIFCEPVVHCAIKWATKSYARGCELAVRVTDHGLRVIVNADHFDVNFRNWLYDHQAERARWALIYVCESWPLRRGLPSLLRDHLAGRARWALVYVCESWPLRCGLPFAVWPHGHLATWTCCLWASRRDARSMYVEAGHFDVGFRIRCVAI